MKLSNETKKNMWFLLGVMTFTFAIYLSNIEKDTISKYVGMVSALFFILYLISGKIKL